MTLLDRHVIQLGDAMLDVRPESEWLELTLGNKKTKFSKQELWAAVFVMSGPKEQDALMPVRTTEVVHIDNRFHRVTLPKDMKKGEKIDVRCVVDVPVAVYDQLKGMIDPGAKVKTTPTIQTKF